MELRKILPTEGLRPVLDFMEIEEIIEIPKNQYTHGSIKVAACSIPGKEFKVVQVNDSTLVIRLK